MSSCSKDTSVRYPFMVQNHRPNMNYTNAADLNNNDEVSKDESKPEMVVKFAEEAGADGSLHKSESAANYEFKPYKMEFMWFKIFALIFFHVALVYGILILPTMANATLVFAWLLVFHSMLGIHAGAHRLWCHRSYQAKFGLRVFLMLCNTMALQSHIYEWTRDHRTHHRFSDTDADPYNRNRGFFFSHIGWTMVRKHPEIKRKGAVIKLDDLEADPIVRFQRKYYGVLAIVCWGVLPTCIPVFFWHEKIVTSFCACVAIRYMITLHVTWLVNSVAHGPFGSKPYNSKIVPVESNIRHLLSGEGFHNYHHQFPWDYSASELGPRDVFNPATAMIDLFASLGWAYDLKKVKPETIANTQKKFGDESGYQRGVGRAIWEWVTGMIVFTSPIWIFVLLKYAYNYSIAQHMPFDLNNLVPF